MKIVLAEGCLNYELTVDGKDFFELSYHQQKEVVHKIAEKVSEDRLLEIVKMVTEAEGKVTESDFCEQCGEYNNTYELNIK